MATIIPNPVLAGMDMGRSFGQAYNDALREGVQQGQQIAAQKNLTLFNALKDANMIKAGLTPAGVPLQGYSPTTPQIEALNKHSAGVENQIPQAWSTATPQPIPAQEGGSGAGTGTSNEQNKKTTTEVAPKTNLQNSQYEEVYRKKQR